VERADGGAPTRLMKTERVRNASGWGSGKTMVSTAAAARAEGASVSTASNNDEGAMDDDEGGDERTVGGRSAPVGGWEGKGEIYECERGIDRPTRTRRRPLTYPSIHRPTPSNQ
jgi:hypothetical protein